MASFVLDGAIDRDAFETYMAHILMPDLCPGDIVVMDSLSSRKGPCVRADRGGLRELAQPAAVLADFNPFENAFAKLTALLRKAAERTVGALGSSRHAPRCLHASRVRQPLRRNQIRCNLDSASNQFRHLRVRYERGPTCIKPSRHSTAPSSP